MITRRVMVNKIDTILVYMFKITRRVMEIILHHPSIEMYTIPVVYSYGVSLDVLDRL